MTETQRLESLLAAGNGGAVTLPRQDARELAQKLKARGEGEAAATLVEKLETPGDVTLAPEEARNLRERLQASGRRWVFGTNEARPMPSMTPPAPEPEPEPEHEPSFFRRIFSGH
jgi:hypothetical protein